MNTLYIAKKMQLAREMYFAILLDRASAGPLIIACSEGGTSIEDLAESHPEKIIKLPVDVFQGLSDEQAAQVVAGLKVSGDKTKAAEQIKALYQVTAHTQRGVRGLRGRTHVGLIRNTLFIASRSSA